MSTGRTLLIFGATGKQGGSTISRLLEADADFTILAVTRNAASSSAQKLAAQSPKIKIVEGDLDNPTGVFEEAKKATSDPIHGVFSVQAAIGPGTNPHKEEFQGKALIDAALANNVQHFVYTSVDRGGPSKSPNNPTNIPHFISKHNIEQHLFSQTQNGERMSYTILRPVAFFDNLVPGFMGSSFAAMWKTMGDKKLQLIATRDIGWFGAQAFMNAEDPLYKNNAISLAGDDLNYAEACKIFKEKTGDDMPTSWWFVAKGLLALVKEMGTMFAWFKEEGYGADLEELRKIYPGLQDFGGYIENSEFMKKE